MRLQKHTNVKIFYMAFLSNVLYLEVFSVELHEISMPMSAVLKVQKIIFPILFFYY